MGPIQATKTGSAKFFQWSGRASRSEFWWYFLALLLGALPPVAIDIWLVTAGLHIVDFPLVLLIYTAVSLLSASAAGARRLHDAGFVGWLVLLPEGAILAGIVGLTLSLGLPPYPDLTGLGWATATFLALTGSLIFLAALWARRSQPGPNKYGPNPHEVTP